MQDRIAKQRLNVILIVDTSKSMIGNRINAVNQAILDVKNELISIEEENTNVDFYMTLMTFSNEASFYNNTPSVRVDEFKFDEIKCKGATNLHTSYDLLSTILKKESKGGIMPDFGGIAPIILLLTDGHPGQSYKEELAKLKDLPWFKASLRYGIAIELNDNKTIKVLRDFVENNGEVIECYDSRILKRIIKIIVVTASKVKSSNSQVTIDTNKQSQNVVLQQEIREALDTNDDWEW